MASFRDIDNPNDMRAYLLDVIDRTLKQDKNACIYHYTDFTSIFRILDSGFFWLGSTQKMNDYLEGEFIETVDGSHRVFSASFSRAEENLAMYKMYAPNPDGAMLVIPLEIAQSMIDELPDAPDKRKKIRIVKDNKLTEAEVDAYIYWAAVVYKELHSDTLRLNRSRNDLIKKPLQVPELAGFVKLHGWEYEKEVRLVAHVLHELSDKEKLAVKLPTGYLQKVKIITGPAFDKTLHRAEIAKLKRLGVTITDSEYDALVDLGGSITNEEKKKILELEKENEALRAKIQAYEEKTLSMYPDFDVIEYKKKYNELRDEATRLLAYYGPVYTNIVEVPDEKHEEASKKLRYLGVEFEVLSRTNKPNDVVDVPDDMNLQKVSGMFIGLSNNMYIHKGGDKERILEDNTKREEKIRKILSI